MIKRFPSRNNRSKGIKVKHVLQIILLVGVCFWLIFQVKHNHDKKKEFDKNDAKLSVRRQTDEILKLGRRDLHPDKVEVNQNEKREEEEEDEHIEEDEENKHDHNEREEGNMHDTEEHEDNKHEGREQEEEVKHGAEEQEEDENKSEDAEDEGRRIGDGEIDENDQEKSEVDTDRDDEFLDEEKEKEEEGDEKDNENEDEEKGGFVENDNNHEAREEHYKGDDASSAVAHDTHATGTETETFSLENSDENLETNITKPENEKTDSDKGSKNQNDSDLKVTEGEVIDMISSNATAGKETGNKSLSNPVDSSYQNKTANYDSNLESSSNLTVTIAETSNNLTEAGANTSGSSEQNKSVILSEADHTQNTTMNTTITGDVKKVQTEGLEQSGNRISEESLPDTDSTVSVKTENGDAAAQESYNLGAGELEKTNRSVASNETQNTSRNESSDTSESDESKGDSEMNETNETQNVDATEDEMFKGDTKTGESDETSDSFFANETLDSVEHDAIDSSDTHIHEDVAEAQTDLDTLPDIRNEGDNSDETAAE
ncbi:dentin sialophosphoprotein-like [Abrus precatorius]|uniref:Dentin sialophosphoprotein-like n=1 Tax=Abrus precatorius TaxID=3816 RepID=A0A8B8MAT2_ABRPR|nr:dentin sialophosphoprotein-like [Abrus precatorius]XP_027365666.1 dentin sialophosphoprotein-like [Abrus precatorius]XP_027365667.1 dentin sialophosphoprotein-like [Abrus precatorius]